MIHVVVGTRHLHAILGHRFDGVLRCTLEPLVGIPIQTVNTSSELAGMTVFEVLDDFHNRASELLRAEPAEIMTAHREEIIHVARQEYHYSDFEATIEDACRSVAIHGVFPHGTLTSRNTKVFLPDFSLGVRCFGFFTHPQKMQSESFQECAAFFRSLDGALVDEAIVKEIIKRLTLLRQQLKAPFAPYDLLDQVKDFFVRPPDPGEMLDRLQHVPTMLDETVRKIEKSNRRAVDGAVDHLETNRHRYDFQQLECHLCDTLLDVYSRADSYWNERRAASRSTQIYVPTVEADFPRVSGEDYLVLDAFVHGFQGHRSLRRDNTEVPALGNHRLLAGRATRQGIGKPVVSGLFPIALWRSMKISVQHFILNAAEKIGAEQCLPLFPNVPSKDDMRKLFWAAERAEGDIGFDVEFYSDSLKKLGIQAAVIERNANFLERLDRGEWAWDWTRAIFEYQSALYDDDIEQSLHLQDILDLYPLHKRLLGLLEYVLVPHLKCLLEKKLQKTQGNKLPKGTSGLWTAAFTGRSDRDLGASIEIEGHWLSEAKRQNEKDATATSLDLASLLDRIIEDISDVPIEDISDALECRGDRDNEALKITLTPENPIRQVRQFAALCEKGNPAAACMTLYMGKIIISLRNYIEHGLDEVDRDCLKIDGSHYWQQPREGHSTYNWILCKSRADSPWRHQGDLPVTLRPPATANALRLTPASLHRCLVLVSLTLQAGISHLGI